MTKGDVHPGALPRMMGSRKSGTKKTSPAPRAANTVTWSVNPSASDDWGGSGDHASPHGENASSQKPSVDELDLFGLFSESAPQAPAPSPSRATSELQTLWEDDDAPDFF